MPKTYEEQVAALRDKGCAVGDENVAVDFFKRVNYYRFIGYLLAFRCDDNKYVSGTCFESVASIYAFDQDLRAIIMRAVGDVEIAAKSTIAYYHTHRYGALGYLNADNFTKKRNHKRFLSQFNTAIENNKSTLFVKHHLKSYKGKFPLWVAVELFTMGMTSFFYADLAKDDKRAIAKEYNTDYTYLETWLHSTTVLRNICAHHGRLYNIRFHQNPKLPREYSQYADMNERSLFKQMYMLRLLYSNNRSDWNNSIIRPLKSLVRKHKENIDLQIMGFPAKWARILQW